MFPGLSVLLAILEMKAFRNTHSQTVAVNGIWSIFLLKAKFSYVINISGTGKFSMIL